VAQLPSLERVIIARFLDPDAAPGPLRDATLYDDYVGGQPTTLEFAQLPFDHPILILYSSGTTGIPKAIVHGAGGTLLQHLKELMLHTDLKRDDRIFYFTTCGWMMWNWLASALAVGATLVLYDGSPFHPDGGRLFDLADREGITVFGTSAKYIDALKKADLEPARSHDLAPLRALLSTGSPLVPESFDFVYRSIKADLHLASISGGTDIVSCFALGNPIAPVWRGELQTRGLGMAVEVWDDDGRPVVSILGELVCTRPFPCMPVGFWNDPDGSRYRGAYFERFPGVWTHGDLVELTRHDGLIIYGRSDAVLNPGGVRIGTAEIYRQVEQIPEVLEALAVGQTWQDDVRVVLFLRLAEGAVLDQALIERIRQRIRSHCTPRHVPAKILAIADIPRTMNGKIAELAVREVIHGRPVKNVEALANPESLELYRDLSELRS
jgi:acetoacetyl-CoA synthetase